MKDKLRVLVETCSNCKMHQWCTHHKESKYIEHFKRVEEYLSAKIPEIEVKRPTRHEIQFLLNERVRLYGQEQRIEPGKLGAFQVFFQNVLIFSKHQSQRWPNLQQLQQAINIGLQQYSKNNQLEGLVSVFKKKFQIQRQAKRIKVQSIKGSSDQQSLDNRQIQQNLQQHKSKQIHKFKAVHRCQYHTHSGEQNRQMKQVARKRESIKTIRSRHVIELVKKQISRKNMTQRNKSGLQSTTSRESLLQNIKGIGLIGQTSLPKLIQKKILPQIKQIDTIEHKSKDTELKKFNKKSQAELGAEELVEKQLGVTYRLKYNKLTKTSKQYILKYLKSSDSKETNSARLKRIEKLIDNYIPSLYNKSKRKDNKRQLLNYQVGFPQVVQQNLVEEAEHSDSVTNKQKSKQSKVNKFASVKKAKNNYNQKKKVVKHQQIHFNQSQHYNDQSSSGHRLRERMKLNTKKMLSQQNLQLHYTMKNKEEKDVKQDPKLHYGADQAGKQQADLYGQMQNQRSQQQKILEGEDDQSLNQKNKAQKRRQQMLPNKEHNKMRSQGQIYSSKQKEQLPGGQISRKSSNKNKSLQLEEESNIDDYDDKDIKSKESMPKSKNSISIFKDQIDTKAVKNIKGQQQCKMQEQGVQVKQSQVQVSSADGKAQIQAMILEYARTKTSWDGQKPFLCVIFPGQNNQIQQMDTQKLSQFQSIKEKADQIQNRDALNTNKLTGLSQYRRLTVNPAGYSDQQLRLMQMRNQEAVECKEDSLNKIEIASGPSQKCIKTQQRFQSQDRAKINPEVQPQVIEQRLQKYKEAVITQKFTNIPHSSLHHQSLFTGYKIPTSYKELINLESKLSPKVAIGLKALLQIDQTLLTRLFDNQGCSYLGKVGIWQFEKGWKLNLVSGNNWLQAFENLYKDTQLADFIEKMTGSSCRLLPVKQKAERIWKLSQSLKSEGQQITSSQHLICLPKKPLMTFKKQKVRANEIYFIQECKIIEGQVQKQNLVKLRCDGKQSWMQFKSFVEEFQSVVVANINAALFHGQVTIPPQLEPFKSVVYFLVKFGCQSIVSFHFNLANDQKGKYVITIYKELQKNKFQLENRARAQHFTKKFKEGCYLFFIEGFKVRWDDRGDLILEPSLVGLQSSSPCKIKCGKWLEASKLGYEDLRELFLPMYQEHSLVQDKASVQKSTRRKKGALNVGSILRKVDFDTSNQQSQQDTILRRQRLRDQSNLLSSQQEGHYRSRLRIVKSS